MLLRREVWELFGVVPSATMTDHLGESSQLALFRCDQRGSVALMKGRPLVGNFVSLSVIQVINFVLPLATLPYLVRVLGPSQYGLVTFAQSFVQYFIIFTSYGFNLSATPQIAISRGSTERVSRISSAVFLAKVLLMSCSGMILSGLLLLIPFFRNHWLLYTVSFMYVLGDVLFPTWLFQGLEDMKFITMGNVISKVLATLGVFLFVRSSNDYLLVPILMAGGNMVGGLVSFIVVVRKYRLNLAFVSLGELHAQLREGWLLFLSTVTVSLYTISNPVILGIFTTPTVVGYYNAAQKLISAGQGILTVVSQVIYPHVSRLMQGSVTQALAFLHRVTLVFAPVTLMTTLLTFALARPIVLILLGSQYLSSVSILRILSTLPFLIFLSNVFGIQTMLNLQLKKQFTRIVVFGAISNLVLSFLLVPSFHATGTALSVLTSEALITLSMFSFLRVKGINLITGRVDFVGI